jgi:hypothetical protein
LPLSNIHSPVTENLIGQGRSRCPNHIDLGPQIDTYNEEVKAIGQSDFSCISVSFWRGIGIEVNHYLFLLFLRKTAFTFHLKIKYV